MGEVLSVIRKIKTDAMSGGEMDDEDDETTEPSPQKEKSVSHVPVQWLNPAIVDMLHAVDTWLPFPDDEKLTNGGDVDHRGNRPLKQSPRDKPAVVGKYTKGLPRNWYEDIWFKSLPPGKQTLVGVTCNEAIPTPVCTNHCTTHNSLLTYCCSLVTHTINDGPAYWAAYWATYRTTHQAT